MMLWVIFGTFMIISLIVSWQLKSRFKKYAQIPLSNGMSGADIAAKMLRDSGIYDVQIVSVEGQLTDHYNPKNKTINLSHDVFYGHHVSAAAVAAHETGHAIQHAHAYAPLQIRSALVPIQNISSTVMNVIFIGMFLGAFLLPSFIPMTLALQIIVFCYFIFTVFAFITLPVEFNASNRALIWLDSSGVATGVAQEKAKDALKWAAMTYVVAALSALATLLYYVALLAGNRD